MIAGSRGRALSRCRWAVPWIVLVVCAGLCLGWHSGDLGLMVERQCVETLPGDPYPVDEKPAEPLSHDAGGRRDARVRTGVPASSCGALAGPRVGRAGGRRAEELSLLAPPAGARRLILLGVSRI
ncbi:hypothetical protein [Streptosporangium carneum]|uniref:Uncharacterized protein n=1 Tax=Streptosporangium carneum TaxID=47481 RepID=A0A9W6I8J6_9ACTN|nr:hypothetical protein [Streptosporangium carneum]GLK12935.1 hypothetical protein GCM10017600_63450 [Streptosporangium carneum]